MIEAGGGAQKARDDLNIVFDFGGVLFRWQPPALIARVLPHHAPSAEAAHALAQDFFQGYDGDWAEFDRGALDVDVLITRVARRTGLSEAEARAVIDGVPGELQPIPETVALLRRLHAAGRPLYFLSNMPAPMANHLETHHDFVGLFRRGVFSSRVQLVKPDRAIFDHAARDFGIAPSKLFFIDDFEANVEAARAAGWQALHFRDPAQCEADLRAAGLL